MGRKAEGYDLSYTAKLEPSFAFVWSAKSAKLLEELVARALTLTGVNLQVHVEDAADYPSNGPEPRKNRGRSGEKKL